MLKEPKRIIAEEPQNPDRWIKEYRNNQPFCRICRNIMGDGGSCQEHRGIMVCDRPEKLARTGRLIWHRLPFGLAICSNLQ